jgi:RHS repeat-associated protein
VTETIDPDHNTTYSFYDPSGNLTVSIDSDNRYTYSYYDKDNRLTETIDPDNNKTYTYYDGAGDVIGTMDGAGDSTTQYFDGDNRVTETIDGDNRVSYTYYDRDGRVTETIDPDHNTSYTYYDGNGNVAETMDADGKTTFTYYNKDGRVTETIDGDGNTTYTAYDAAGNVTGTVDGTGKLTQDVLDKAGNVTETIDPNSNTSQTLYDGAGRVTETIDGNGNKTYTFYDGNGNVIESIDGDGHITFDRYDPSGRLTEVIDPDNNVTKYTYDGNGHMLSMTDALTKTATYAYDNAGNLTSETTRDGLKENITYDGDGRKLTETDYAANGTTVLNTYTFTYDGNGNMLTAADNAGTDTYTYDPAGRLTVLQEPFGVTLTFSYDSAGNRTLMVDSLGGTTTSVYDGNGQLTSRQFSGNGETLRFDQTWTGTGNLATVNRYSNLAGTALVGTSSYTYDAGGRVTQILHKNGSGTGLETYTYSYDPGNRLTSETDNGTTTTYSYDSENQLMQAGSTAYSFDANGNANASGDVVGKDDLLQNDGTWTYTYDNDNNLIEKSKGSGLETWFYTYDDNDRMLTAIQTTNGSTAEMRATYTYDAQGNRIEQDVWTQSTGTVTTRFAYDDHGDLLAQLNSSNALTVRFVSPDGADQYEAAVTSAGVVTWMLTDHLGSVRAVMNPITGTETDRLAYSAYGAITSESNPSVAPLPGFTGGVQDRNTAFVMLGARYLNTQTDRWTTEDPSGLGPDINPNRYVGNGPTDGTDPSGLQFVRPENMVAKQGSKEFAAQLLLSAFSNWRTNNLRFGSSRPSDLERDWKDFTAELRQVLAKPPSPPAAPGSSSISGITSTEAAASKQRLAQAQKDQEDQIKKDAFWAHTRLIVAGSMPANYEAIEQADKIYQRERRDLYNKLSDTQQAIADSFEVLLIQLATLGLGEIFALGAAASLETEALSTESTLTAAAARANATVGAGRGAVHGTAVHSAFEAEVNALGNADLATEVSYLNGQVVPRGTAGSVRLDVVEGPATAPKAIFDLKTGSAKLTPARIKQIQQNIPGGSNVPVIEIR